MSPVFFLLLGILLLIIDFALILATVILFVPVYIKIKAIKRRRQLFLVRFYFCKIMIAGIAACVAVPGGTLPEAAVYFRKKITVYSVKNIKRRFQKNETSGEKNFLGLLKAAASSLRIRHIEGKMVIGTGDAAQTALLCGASGVFVNCIAAVYMSVHAAFKPKNIVVQIVPDFENETFFISGDCIICLKIADIIRKMKEQK